jgi:hypothetical protein
MRGDSRRTSNSGAAVRAADAAAMTEHTTHFDALGVEAVEWNAVPSEG